MHSGNFKEGRRWERKRDGEEKEAEGTRFPLTSSVRYVSYFPLFLLHSSHIVAWTSCLCLGSLPTKTK